MEGLIIERVAAGRVPRWGKWVASSYQHVEAGRLTGAHNQLRDPDDRLRGWRATGATASRGAVVTRPCR